MHTPVEKWPENLKRNCLVIKDGKVVDLKEYVLWNNTPANTLHLERLGPDKFGCYAEAPGHGGGYCEGTLTEVISGFHPDIQAMYVYIFSLTELSPHQHYPMLTWYEIKELPVAVAV